MGEDPRALDDILERAADGSWSRCEKGFDEFSEVTVEDDIIVGFNLLVRAPAANRLHLRVRPPSARAAAHRRVLCAGQNG